MGSGSKVSESVNLRDTLRNNDKGKRLEIATDFQPLRTNLVTRSQTLKHKDLAKKGFEDSLSRNIQPQQSYEFNGKYSPKNGNLVANHFLNEKDKNNAGNNIY